MPTALFVQQDARTVLVCRNMRATCTREEWDTPRWRQAAIDKAWAAVPHAIRAVGDLTLVTPAPVTLYRSTTGEVLYADRRLSAKAPPDFIWPDGRKMSALLAVPAAAIQRTTYKHFAEGYLPHIELMPAVAELSAEDREVLDALPNGAIREQARAALVGAGVAHEARTAPPTDTIVDFFIRGIFSMPDYTVFASKQSAEGHKVVVGNGLWDGKDDEPVED